MKAKLPVKDLYLNTTEKREKVELLEGGVKSVAKSTPNMAIYGEDGTAHDVIKAVLQLIQSAKNTFEYGRQQMYIAKWKKADNWYWMLEKQSRLPELAISKVCASSFYRSCRRLQDGAYVATFSTDDLPVKFMPMIDPRDDSESKEVKAAKATAVNKCAADYFAKERIKADPAKARRAYHMAYKYGNVIVYTPWLYEVGKRFTYEDEQVNVPFNDNGMIRHKHSKTGEISDTPFPPESKIVEKEVILKDSVGFMPLPIENVWLDDRIEDINRQTYLLWRSDMTRDELFQQAKNGVFKNVEKVNDTHKWQLFSYESTFENDRRQDASKDSTQSMASEMYERWQSWVMLPKIEVKKNSKGDVTDLIWDQNAEPRRYLIECIGSVMGTPIVVNFRESPYWSNNVPFIMAHSHDDDSGAYHRGLIDLLDDNMVQEAVTKAQLMDNRSLMNRRPQIWVKGRVMNKTGEIGHNHRFFVTSRDAIDFMQVPDISGTIGNTLAYLKDESGEIAQTPKFMMGEAAGARTSATEIAAIRDLSTAPAMADVKTLNLQLWGGYMQKILEYLPQFEEDQIRVALEGQEYLVEAQKIEESDIMIREVAIQEYDNKMMQRQIVNNMIQVLSTSPLFQGTINPMGLLVRWFSLYPEITPNPEELLIKNEATSKLLLEWQASSIQADKEKLQLPDIDEGQQQGMGIVAPEQAPGGMPGLPAPSATRAYPSRTPQGDAIAGMAGQMGGV